MRAVSKLFNVHPVPSAVQTSHVPGGGVPDYARRRAKHGDDRVFEQDCASTAQSPAFEKAPKFVENARVLAKWRASEGGTKWYPGKVCRLQDGGTCTIAYDDGDIEDNVMFSNIKLHSHDSGQPQPPSRSQRLHRKTRPSVSATTAGKRRRQSEDKPTVSRSSENATDDGGRVGLRAPSH